MRRDHPALGDVPPGRARLAMTPAPTGSATCANIRTCWIINRALMGVARASLLQNHRWIAYVGLAAILYVALEMMYRGTHEVLRMINDFND